MHPFPVYRLAMLLVKLQIKKKNLKSSQTASGSMKGRSVDGSCIYVCCVHKSVEGLQFKISNTYFADVYTCEILSVRYLIDSPLGI